MRELITFALFINVINLQAIRKDIFDVSKTTPTYMKKFSLPNPNLGLEITCKPHTTKFSKPGSWIRLFQIRLPHTTQFSKPRFQ